MLGDIRASCAMDERSKMLILFAVENLHTRSIDFVVAYPQVDLNVRIFVELPQGFNAKSRKGCVLQLEKNVCKLKQAGKNWFQKLLLALKNILL